MIATVTLNPAVDRTITVEGVLTVGAVHRIGAETQTPGGKGVNVAKAVAAAGGEVVAACLLGRDRRDWYARELERAGIRVRLLCVPHPTRMNVMAVDGGGRELKLNAPGYPELAPDWPALRQFVREAAASPVEVVIFSGSLPARFPADTYARLSAELRAQGKTVVVDAAGDPLRAAVGAGVDAIKPNRRELAGLTNKTIGDRESLLEALRIARQSVELVIVSDGSAGAYFADRSGILFGRAPEVEAIDSTGAGDTLLGQFCADYFPSRRLTPELTARAVAAGAGAVELPGTPTVPIARILELADQVQVESCG